MLRQWECSEDPTMADIRPIRNDEDHELAIREIDRIWTSTAAEDMAVVAALSLLVEAYETARWPFETALDPIDMIKHAMTPDVGHTRQDFVAMIGSPSGASQILARKRPLTLDMIRKISAKWGIAIELLTPAYRLDVPMAKAIMTKA